MLTITLLHYLVHSSTSNQGDLDSPHNMVGGGTNVPPLPPHHVMGRVKVPLVAGR